MKTVLILNHKKVKCGTYQLCERVYNLASKSTKVNYIYREIDSAAEFHSVIAEIQPQALILNYHFDRMAWLGVKDFQGITKATCVKYMVYIIFHDGSLFSIYDRYLMFGNHSPEGGRIPDIKKIVLPRPLLNYTSKPRPENEVPTIGSFGFAFSNKGFPELVRRVAREFPRAVVNIHLTSPFFGDAYGKISDIIAACGRESTNNITLNITTDFVDNDTLLERLDSNDINILNYAPYHQPGLSSAVDYLLSVKRPIGISNHSAFRHIISDGIRLDKNPIKDIISRGIEPLQKFYDEYNTERFVTEMEKLFL